MIGDGIHYHRQPLLQEIRWNGHGTNNKLNNNATMDHLAAVGCIEPGASLQRHLPENNSFKSANRTVYYDKRNNETNCRINAIDNGPFVFGVHSPSQFKLDNNINYGDEDYADPCADNSPTDALYCDRKIKVKQTENRQTSFRRKMFRIQDNRADHKTKNKFTRKGGTKDKIKCVLVGDGAVGKTSLITSYAQNKFSCDYRPTAFDNYNVRVEIDDRPIAVEICDTAGQDSMQGLRELCYPGTDVIMICFSVVKPKSFKSVITRWGPRITSINAPLILIGTQSDLRDDYNTLHELMLRGEAPISETQGKELASTLNALYIETSSKTRWKLKEAFDSAILAALPIRKKKKSFLKTIFSCLS